jgi:phosphoglycerate kinase
MNLPKLENQELKEKKILVRADLDVDEKEDYRLQALLPTLKLLQEKEAEIILIGHRGRPEGKVVEELKMKPVEDRLRQIAQGINFSILENLRFNPGEESNDPEFAEELAKNGEFYVNESFATCHRNAASITSLPKLLPHAAGLRLEKEIENLSKVLKNPKRPVVFLVSGLKEDKLASVEPLKKIADKILIAGRLPDYLGDDNPLRKDPQILVADLIADKEDITLNSIERFKKEIEKAGIIVVAGPMGKYEDEGHRQGTTVVFEAVSKSSAFKVAGGGDSVTAINLLKLASKFDWISVGGGAMLEFLVKGTLPGIEALLG